MYHRFTVEQNKTLKQPWNV